MDNAAEQKIKKALERLMAVQNGPPLIRDAQEWREAMTDCDAALALLTEPKPPKQTPEEVDAALKKFTEAGRKAWAGVNPSVWVNQVRGNLPEGKLYRIPKLVWEQFCGGWINDSPLGLIIVTKTQMGWRTNKTAGSRYESEFIAQAAAQSWYESKMREGLEEVKNGN